ncbi:Serine/threonine-protein kinase SRPK [Lachnellula suecica]|uniref:Serine/threonine-protein kinase SRPK n=1 Tax=Lachnellula suecica TaxID=602035 RepID=A0A8T9C1P5_9HELO|nr:Serine/threonine-protein kinase SRPK [Lachnellula suecica]
MSSNPSTPLSPTSTTTNSELDGAGISTINLHLELSPFDLEHIHDYELGGHHPVHLGDVYGRNGRYRVIHKLGHGGSANVWLCRDTEADKTNKYVALKILMAEVEVASDAELSTKQLKGARGQAADGAELICTPLEDFKIQGPNGDHVAFVYPVLGPSVSRGLFRASADPDSGLRRISLQVTKAVDFLHSRRICHGDITPNNILHRVSGLNGLAVHEVLQILGSPVLNPVMNASNECHNEPTAPKYLVYPVNWSAVDTQYISKSPCLIDLGESFHISQPPENLGTPGPYRSPELLLDKKAGLGSDIWALGCTLFEIRTGRKLFDTFDDGDDDYLDAMVQVLGKLPERWWEETWEARRRIYRDEVDERGLVVAVRELEPSQTFQEGNGIISTVHPSVAVGARSLLDALAPGLWYMPDQPGSRDCHRDISQEEKERFAELLGRLLKYRPEERRSAKDAMNHEWFVL